MAKLVENVRHQGWLQLLEELDSLIFEEDAREFFYLMDFSKDGLS